MCNGKDACNINTYKKTFTLCSSQSVIIMQLCSHNIITYLPQIYLHPNTVSMHGIQPDKLISYLVPKLEAQPARVLVVHRGVSAY